MGKGSQVASLINKTSILPSL